MTSFKFSFLFILLLWNHATSAQPAEISGKAPAFANQQVLVYANADPLSQHPVMLYHSDTDAEGNFTLRPEIQRTKPLQIKINHVSGFLVAKPGNKYNIFFPELAEDQSRSFSGTTYVELIFTDPQPNDINAVLSDINFAVDSMLMANVEIIGTRYFPPKLSAFEDELKRRFTHYEDPYIQQHLKYTLALTEWSTRTFTRLDLYKRHLSDGSWQMHPTFFEFLRSYFQQYFRRFESNFGSDLIKPALQKPNPGEELLGLMKKDNLLENDTLRELVAIHALMESYYDKFSPRNIIAALDYIAKTGTTDFVKEAAKNTQERLTATTAGFKAPELRFLNQHNEPVSLNQFSGKYIYLEFISTWCTDCKREQSILPDLREEYGDVVEIITVVVDSPLEDYQQYLASNPHFDWNVLYDGTGYESIDKYRVRALPSYFLIGPEGKLVLSPAPSPTDGIVEQLYPVLQKAKEEQRFKIGDR